MLPIFPYCYNQLYVSQCIKFFSYINSLIIHLALILAGDEFEVLSLALYFVFPIRFFLLYSCPPDVRYFSRSCLSSWRSNWLSFSLPNYTCKLVLKHIKVRMRLLDILRISFDFSGGSCTDLCFISRGSIF